MRYQMRNLTDFVGWELASSSELKKKGVKKHCFVDAAHFFLVRNRIGTGLFQKLVFVDGGGQTTNN